MSDIMLGTDDDLEFDGVDLQIVDGADAILQHLKQRLKLFLGEWFLDTRRGVAYFQQILKKNPDPVAIDGIFKSTIVNTPGILELLEFDLDMDLHIRQLTLNFKALTTEGVLDFSEVIP